MFEKLFKRFKKQEPSTPIESTTQENAEAIKEQNNAIDSTITLSIEQEVRELFNDFDADPSDLEECFYELDDIKMALEKGFHDEYQDEEIRNLANSIISKVFEEKLIAIGSSLDAFHEWEVKETLPDEFFKEETPEENIVEEETTEKHFTR